MAAAIDVVQGPDAGWRYVMVTGDVRLGRGAGHQIKISDPAWGDGHLRVQFRQGGYLVTNLMPYPIYLDGQLLEEGQQATWYAGGSLQPTAATLLRLDMAETPAGPPPEGGVYVVSPVRTTLESKKSKQWILLAVIVCVGLGLAVYSMTKGKSTQVTTETHATVDAKLALALAGKADPKLVRLRESLGIAAFRESGNDLPGAYQKYREAQAQLTEIPEQDPATPIGQAMAAADQFLNARLSALARDPALTRKNSSRSSP